MSNYQDPEFPNGRRITIGEGQWGVTGNVSTDIGGKVVTEFLFIEAAPGTDYKGVKKMTLTKDQLKRVIAKGEFDTVYPWQSKYIN